MSQEGEELILGLVSFAQLAGPLVDGFFQVQGMPFESIALDFQLAMESAGVKSPAQGSDEIFAVNRLLDEVIGAATQRLHGQIVLPMTGDKQGGSMRSNLADSGQERQPVDARHLNVADDRFIISGRDPFQGNRRGFRLFDDDRLHAQLKHFTERFQKRRVVVDDQNVRFGHASSSSP